MQDGSTPKQEIQVAYLGPSASFSHQAALEAFSTYPSTKVQPLPSFEAILSGVQTSSSGNNESNQASEKVDFELDFALLPVENSTNGGVVPVLDLLTKCDAQSDESLYPDVEVVGEHYLEVHHCLYIDPVLAQESNPDVAQESNYMKIDGASSINESTSPLTSSPHRPLYQVYDITTIYTHPQVWGQCAKFLSYHFPTPQVERRNMSSTSAAAAFVAQQSRISDVDTTASSTRTATAPPPLPTPRASETGNIAAICSSLAGSQNHLFSPRTKIEDEPGKNTTRFFIIRNRKRAWPQLQVGDGDDNQSLLLPWQRPPSSASKPTPKTNETPRSISYKSLITFTVPHQTSGSLALALAVFQKHHFNLTAITTRPSREQPWHYVFFIECEATFSPVSSFSSSSSSPSSPSPSSSSSSSTENQSKIRTMFEELSRVTQRSTLMGSWVNRLRTANTTS